MSASPALSVKARKAVIDGLTEQGAKTEDRSGGVLKVTAPDGSAAVINLGVSNPRSLFNARTRIKRLGLYWPLDDDGYRPEKRAQKAPEVDPRAVKEARARALAAEARISAQRPTVTAGSVDEEDGDETLETQADEPLEGWIDLTPELAEQLLGKNTDNRNIRQNHVAELARDMLAGNWEVTGDSIKIDINDVMVDGQHRCLAVIKSGVTIRVLLVIGLHPKARDVVDTNAKRSAADALRFEGNIKNVSIVAAIARIDMHRENGGWIDSSDTSNPTGTNSEVLDWVANHPEVHRAAAIGSRATSMGFVPSTFGYFAMEALAVNEDAAMEFIDSILGGVPGSVGDPRHTLLRWMATQRANRRKPRGAESLFVLHHTWNKWRSDEEMTRMYAVGRGGGAKIVRLAK